MTPINGIAGKREDFQLMQGDTWDYIFQVLDFNGDPLDLSLATSITARIWEDQDKLPSLEFELGDGIAIEAVSNMHIQKIVNLRCEQAFFAIELGLPPNLNYTVLYGFHKYLQKGKE